MKSITLLFLSAITTLSVFAQNITNTVTIQVNGSRNRQVVVDGRTYSLTDYSNASNTTSNVVNDPITITDLPVGQHTLQVLRNSQNNSSRRNGTTTSFNLRTGYNLLITVNGDGSVQLKESRNRGNRRNNMRSPMTDANFTVLLQNVKRQWNTGSKVTLLASTFANTANYFTTQQVIQLIQTVRGESGRLQLAKSSYRSIVDPVNFSQVSNLLTSQAGRNELAAYVSSYNANNNNNNNPVYNNNGSQNSNQYRSQMSDANFNILVQDIQKQWLPGAKMSGLTNAFANTNNYFSTYQAKQLIQLISDEPNRLQLAKASYRTIVDPANFTQIYEVLNTQASRNELAAYINSYNNNSSYNNNNSTYNNNNSNNQYRSAMSDVDYNALVQQVESQWLPGAKMTALTSIFANTSYYFTTLQAKQLINYVSDENNRLQLAKSSYRNIVDPGNFSQVYDLLTSQASRDELTAYVNSVR